MPEHWKEHRLKRELSDVRARLQEMKDLKSLTDRDRHEAVAACEIALRAIRCEQIDPAKRESVANRLAAVVQRKADAAVMRKDWDE